MKIQSIGINYLSTTTANKQDVKKITKPIEHDKFDVYDKAIANVNKSYINFRGYYGDIQPVKKMFYIMSGKNAVYEDAWTNSHLYQVGIKKWVNAHPIELLKRTPEQAIQSICTLIKPNNQYPGIPPYIPSPNFGDKWGRHANYIEINPRAIAKYDYGNITDGLLQTMKLLPAIPTSHNAFANCIVLSQLYPTWYGDGTVNSSSQYCSDLHTGISNNLTSQGLYAKMGADEQVKAFNDLAHLLGFKTGFRMLLPSGQLRVQEQPFNWYDHERAFIDACVWGIDLGFDSIYFDSAKHIIDKYGYCGNGSLPNKNQMGYILHEIRSKTGRNDLSFIGEKCNNNPVYKEMGFTAGTDWGRADNIDSVKWESRNQAWNREYAAGPEVSNDNDDGSASFAQRLNRINSCLFGYDNIHDKLPSFMHINDIMPYEPGINTHDLMLRTIQANDGNAWTECERHWNGMFDKSWHANEHRNNAYHIFENVLKYSN